MANSFNKTYSITVKYSRSDGAAILDSDPNVVILRAKIKAAITAAGHATQQGIHDSHIVGTVSET